MIIDQAGRAARTTRYLRPPPGLQGWVEEAWIQAYPASIREEVDLWRIVPDLQPHLLLHGAPGRSGRGLRIVGARSTYLDRPVGSRRWTAGVTLASGAIPPLTGLSAADLRDRSAHAADVWGAEGRRLAEVVGAAEEPERVVGLLFDFLSGRVEEGKKPVDWRVKGFTAAAAGRDAPRVGEVAESMGVSPRTLRKVWTREVGLSPRRALSVLRLHRAVKRALGRPRRTWSEVALAAGYYDQAHLIRDFHALLGETPEDFRSRGRFPVDPTAPVRT